jgi:hypothetical protein
MSSARNRFYLACFLSATALGAQAVWAQSSSQPSHDTTTKPHSHGAGTASDASAKSRAVLKADLIEPEKKAKEQAATVKVEVTGVEIVDPATVGEKPKAGQAHLHYQVDDGPVVATTAPKLSFHGLKPGEHKVLVMLAANDHSPLGPKETLSLRVTPTASK